MEFFGKELLEEATIKPCDWLWLWALPTHTYQEGSVSIQYKVWRGVIYVVGMEGLYE